MSFINTEDTMLNLQWTQSATEIAPAIRESINNAVVTSNASGQHDETFLLDQFCEHARIDDLLHTKGIVAYQSGRRIELTRLGQTFGVIEAEETVAGVWRAQSC